MLSPGRPIWQTNGHLDIGNWERPRRSASVFGVISCIGLPDQKNVYLLLHPCTLLERSTGVHSQQISSCGNPAYALSSNVWASAICAASQPAPAHMQPRHRQASRLRLPPHRRSRAHHDMHESIASCMFTGLRINVTPAPTGCARRLTHTAVNAVTNAPCEFSAG